MNCRNPKRRGMHVYPIVDHPFQKRVFDRHHPATVREVRRVRLKSGQPLSARAPSVDRDGVASLREKSHAARRERAAVFERRAVGSVEEDARIGSVPVTGDDDRPVGKTVEDLVRRPVPPLRSERSERFAVEEMSETLKFAPAGTDGIQFSVAFLVCKLGIGLSQFPVFKPPF